MFTKLKMKFRIYVLRFEKINEIEVEKLMKRIEDADSNGILYRKIMKKLNQIKTT